MIEGSQRGDRWGEGGGVKGSRVKEQGARSKGERIQGDTKTRPGRYEDTKGWMHRFIDSQQKYIHTFTYHTYLPYLPLRKLS